MRTLNRRLLAVLVGFWLLILSACASSDVELPGGMDNLEDTRWRLVSYGQPGAENQVIEGTEVTLQLEDQGQALGSGGCNTFGAQYKISGGEISITSLISTLLACTVEGVMEQEEAYFQALQAAGEFESTDDQLRVWYDNGGSVLNFVRIES